MSCQEFSQFSDLIPGESRDKMCRLLPLELEECDSKYPFTGLSEQGGNRSLQLLWSLSEAD